MDEATRAKYEEITKQLTGRYRAARQAPVAAVGTERLAIGFRDPDLQTHVLESTLEAFRLATECFRAVVRNHPESPWAHDAREKTALLRSLYVRYVRMAQSLDRDRPDGADPRRQLG